MCVIRFRTDWAHPHHGTILASCGFDKLLKTWMPPQEPKKSGSDQGWTETTSKVVDRRGSVTDVRFAPVWFDPERESPETAPEPAGHSNTCYLACCTLDGAAKVYKRRASENNKNVFEEDRDLLILKNKVGFKCYTLDWSRLRNADQLMVIGGDARQGERRRENVLVMRHVGAPQIEDAGARAWLPVENVPGIDGPVNIVRFAQNAAPHHTLAVGAKQVHILKIEARAPHRITPLITVDTKQQTREKCWRLTWDSIGSVLYTCHGSRTTLCWKRECPQPGQEMWRAEEKQ